jgi:hypothetical protein
VNVAVPVPLDVFVVSAVVGEGEVDQHTPFDEIDEPPSDEIVPPELAVVCVIELIAVVVNVGIVAADVVKVTVEPYDVPAEFVAYALKL